MAAEEAGSPFMRRAGAAPLATLQRFGIYEVFSSPRAMSPMWAGRRAGSDGEAFLVMGFERLKSRLPE